MPRIHNNTADELNLRIGRSIPANGDLEVTDDEARVLAGHPCLSFEADSAPSPELQPDAELAAAEAELVKAQEDLAAAQAADAQKESN